MKDKFLKRLKEIREYEWNNYDIKIYQEFSGICPNCINQPCRACNGSGRWDHADFFDLSPEEREGHDYSSPCPNCKGGAEKGLTNCTFCKGTRIIEQKGVRCGETALEAIARNME